MPDDDEAEQCGAPCSYEGRCGQCDPYWQRVIEEGLYEPGVGWTERGIRAATYLGSV
jgi:hypothetical protein